MSLAGTTVINERARLPSRGPTHFAGLALLCVLVTAGLCVASGAAALRLQDTRSLVSAPPLVGRSDTLDAVGALRARLARGPPSDGADDSLPELTARLALLLADPHA